MPSILDQRTLDRRNHGVDDAQLYVPSPPENRHLWRLIEVFSPPYLFCGERPVILQHPEQITYEQSFSIRVFPARGIRQVVLMRPEVLTHVTNTDQRLLELEFRVRAEETLEIL